MFDWSSIGPALVPLAGAAAVLLWRLSETRRPVKPRTILLPPLAMSSGFLMFLTPAFRVRWEWALGAFLSGAFVLAIPLVRSTTLTRQGTAVVMQRSRSFIAILLGLLGLRLLLRNYVSHILPAPQTAAVFFILAFGMIVRWRIWMWRAFQRLVAGVTREDPP